MTNGDTGVLEPSSLSNPVTQMFATGSHICRSCGFWPGPSEIALRMYMNWLFRTVWAGWLAAAAAILASSTAAVSGAVGVGAVVGRAGAPCPVMKTVAATAAAR